MKSAAAGRLERIAFLADYVERRIIMRVEALELIQPAHGQPSHGTIACLYHCGTQTVCSCYTVVACFQFALYSERQLLCTSSLCWKFNYANY